jgi:hypothetical protein
VPDDEEEDDMSLAERLPCLDGRFSVVLGGAEPVPDDSLTSIIGDEADEVADIIAIAAAAVIPVAPVLPRFRIVSSA